MKNGEGEKMKKIEKVEDFWLCADEVTEGFLFAMLTDEILWECWPSDENERRQLRESVQRKEQKLLDIRIFDTQREARMLRGDIGRTFQGRMIDDTKEVLKSQEYFDEEQYLDIDSKRSKELLIRERKVQATGGGCYPMPLPGLEEKMEGDFGEIKVKLRNYLDFYKDTGQAYVRDWRLVKVFQERRSVCQDMKETEM